MALVFITDRTFGDTTYAYNNQNDSAILKGALNFEDLNRIEGNMQQLQTSLAAIGYYLDLTYKTNWTMDDILDYDETNRIRSNLKTLIIKWVDVSVFPPVTISDILEFTEVNNWERTIELMFEYIGKSELYKRYCGDYICGE